MDPTTLMGTIGALITINAFVMNQVGKWKADNFYYDLSNFVGSAILLIYAFFIHSYPFIILFLIWTAVSIKDVLKDIKRP